MPQRYSTTANLSRKHGDGFAALFEFTNRRTLDILYGNYLITERNTKND